jgi:hypothetical protein
MNNRRDFLKTSAAAGALPLAPAVWAAPTKRDGRVAQENSKPGTVEWLVQYTRFDDPITLASYPLNRRLRSSAIEGYASRTSLLPGETVDFMVSMANPGNFLLDIYRLGYYGGKGGRHMARLGSFKAGPQKVPMMTVERLRECAWEKSASLTIPKDWPSGVYLGKLTRDEEFGVQSYVIFVVKEHRPADLLCQVSDLTWQAYNKWPGKDSLYDDGTPTVWYTGPNVRVSLDRPYAKYCQVLDSARSAGSGEFLLWEHPMAFWLEQQGYDVTYCSNVDLHLDPGILKSCKAFLSVAHDEYWSRKMFDEALKAREDGLSIAFFSGNAVCFEIEFYDSSITGAPCRAFARKKMMGDEDRLMGVKTYGSARGDWVVTKPEHWIYEGTGVKAGDRIHGLIGWEYHGTPAKIPGLEVVAASPLFPRSHQLNPDQRHAAVVFPCPKGNWVFNAGTIWWAEGLSNPPGHIPAPGTFGEDTVVQRVTANILDRMIRDAPRRG